MTQKIQSEESEYERFFNPFIQLAHTTSWRYGLNILYCNGNVLNFGEGMNIPVLISKDGTDDGLDRMIDLLKGKAAININQSSPFLMELFKQKFLPILSSLISLSNSNQSDFLEQQKNTIDPELTGLLIQASFLLSETLGVQAFDTLKHRRQLQIDNTLDDDSYEKMIDDLQTMEIINSQLSVSICQYCGMHHITLSPNPWVEEACSQCGEEWTTLTLYTFDPNYVWFKSRNSDLPLFISSYLKYKIQNEIQDNPIQIFPNAKIELNNKFVEVDVYFPQLKSGIECKNFHDWFMTPTPERLSGVIGKLIPQIENYVSAEIENILVVTNLTNETVVKLLPMLNKSMNEKNIKLNSINIIGRDVNNLVSSLDQMANRVIDFIKSEKEGINPK